MARHLLPVLAALIALALLPAAAHASAMVIHPVVQGPGAISGCGPVAQGNAAKHACGELDLGMAGEASSSGISLTATPNLAQPNKSAFAGWTCSSLPASNICDNCDNASTCSLYSPTSIGTYTLTVTAVFKDTTKPVLTNAKVTQSATVQGQVFLGYTADDAIGTQYCSLDVGAWTVCPAGNAFELGEGLHTIAVKAADPSGNLSDATPPVAFKVVDTTITGGPDGKTTEEKPTFTYTSGIGAAFQCSLDNAAFAACGNGAQTVGPLEEGKHTFAVRALGDLTPAVRTFSVGPERITLVHTPTPTPTPMPAPVPAVPAPAAAPTHLKVAVSASGKGTKLKAVTLRGVPLDATVNVSCTCSHKRVSKRGATRITTFHKLPYKAKLTVTVSAPGASPAVATIMARRGRAPRVSLHSGL
jgi:hypothetical protein